MERECERNKGKKEKEIITALRERERVGEREKRNERDK